VVRQVHRRHLMVQIRAHPQIIQQQQQQQVGRTVRGVDWRKYISICACEQMCVCLFCFLYQKSISFLRVILKCFFFFRNLLLFEVLCVYKVLRLCVSFLFWLPDIFGRVNHFHFLCVHLIHFHSFCIQDKCDLTKYFVCVCLLLFILYYILGNFGWQYV
jgi:hypothetical protein